jgi:hypothetical protein
MILGRVSVPEIPPDFSLRGFACGFGVNGERVAMTQALRARDAHRVGHWLEEYAVGV